MWVEGGDIQDELLDRLGGVLAPPEDLALTPSAEELEALALAVAARWPEGAVAPETGGEVHRLRLAGPRARRIGSSAWRAGSVAAGIVLFSASAAAASGGVPLPRPVRVVAYTVGLPVDSPALDDTHQHIKELEKAVKANDKPKAEATVRRLMTDQNKVPADEKKQAKPKIEAAITAAANTGLVENPLPTTTTTAPTTTTTVTAPASSTTATTAEEQDKEKERDKDRSAVPTTEPTTRTTEPESTTTTTAPPTDGTAPGDTPGDPGPSDGHMGPGPGGDPSTTPTTVPQETTTTTTTAPPPEETTTTTTTAPEPVTTTTTVPPAAP